MKIEKISTSQLLFLIIGQVQGGTVLASIATGSTKHDTWLALIAGFIMSLPWVWMYHSILTKFPGKNLVQIHAVVYGPYLGSALSILYIFFYLSIAASLLRVVGDFVSTYLLPETPMAVSLIMFIFLAAWGLRYGLEVIARCSVLFVIIATIVAIITFFLLLKDMQFTNFFPVGEAPLGKFLQGSQTICAGSFQIAVFLMIAPYGNNIKKLKKTLFLGLLFGCLSLLIVAVRNTAVLGVLEPLMSFASYRAIGIINIGNILTRLEVLVSIGLLLALFMRICMSFYATVLATGQLLNLKNSSPLLFPVAIIIMNFALVAFDSIADLGVFEVQVMPFYFFLFEYVFPLILLFSAKKPKAHAGKGVACP